MSMEIRAITATVQCTVSGGEGHLTAELDSRAWGLNGGRTQYFPGDSAFAIIYLSKNVNIVGSLCVGVAGQTNFTVPTNPVGEPIWQTDEVGYNIVREGVTFNSPVSQIGKPPSATPITLGQSFMRCGGPSFILNTTMVRLATWQPTMDPRQVPPYGYMFVEYTPSAIIGQFTGLGIPTGVKVFSYPNTAIIYGVASPMLP